jgi:gluconate kinase
MKSNLLIVFGKPGAGKSYVAEILEKQFGYFSYNGDDGLPQDMKDALFRKIHITDEMRRRFLENMVAEIKKLSRQHNKLVVHQTFLKENMRKKILNEFPNAWFVLVECNDNIREKRYMERKYFNLGLPYLRKMTNLFEPVHIPHGVLYNNIEGLKNIEQFIRDNL